MLTWWKLPVPTISTLQIIEPFDWNHITPSTSIHYHDCFDGFQCARLDVPMDYQRSDGRGRRMALALTRLPAKVPATDPRYGGAVLINPGGPGGSGVFQVLRSGRNLQTIVDADANPDIELDETAKYFDIIGFDPRGVNNTTPGFSCFPDLFSQFNWEMQTEADGLLGAGEGSLMRNWQRNQALAEGCSRALATASDGEDEALGHHMNTPPLARDMIEIIERQAEWRGKQGKIEQKRHDKKNGYDAEQTIASRTRWNQGQEKLLFWGRSYGTLLGTTFATMFPDRIDRMLLDGVVNVERYYHGIGPSSVVDADAIFERFFLYCDQVGPELCAMYREGGVAAIKEVYQTLKESISNTTIAVPASATRGPEVITPTDLKNLVRVAMYQPMAGFPLLAQHLGQLALGNGSSMADWKQASRTPYYPSLECQQAGPFSRECMPPGQNELYAMSAIMCSDADFLGVMDEGGFVEMWNDLRKDSTMLGDYWAQLLMACTGWKAPGKWRVDGPYTANTSHPLLFVSNTLDPVTPLNSAHTMSRHFPGSAVLQQESEGHTTIAAPSLCIAAAIRKYFQTGELPLYDTICDSDMKPLLGSIKTQDVHDEKVYAALIDEMNQIRGKGLL
ncbi:hypothetical protein ASPWEDRAFT_177510 [Aspergillus wentii DTO 134E9]|uniref:Peptidase S33 tripeptidyl aminopeptidase-like C-terminal domain-containing protein n=1 Tax=Aspergillus wentii DTO 134E9 TaxID=1073089 RepID=A0A1L9R4C5_ASPWE|nr:uncharacterized protein ASPWEDRAFT_177510 [Aspergillus wentii DTO 134E9]OJJ29769.1 hypothetical protein ASPWEDRAFT_177510 [Aspergillus wentii DTO 134E9]